ncbi:hypothetical protein SAMN05216251_108240 [Actinacidiphila alni]|uniref:Uncharacterized protein n=1 Tax=Actinacidiphila alni TaxID=380248 RepID=A0A1I2G5K7_9ACTN|nr:hypothetical protein [Actinacidiphila alni]SFF11911.1 hypothetical protein SAMN05216251_108240 [Actinacidiphila alni]
MSCELCERPADAYLCPACAADLADRLDLLPALYEQLGDMLAPARGDGGRTATVVTAPIPVRLDVVDHRTAFAVLPSWARALADDREQAAQVLRADDLGARVTAACAVLRGAVPWIAATWPAAADLAREVRDLYDGARTVVGADDLPARMGRCPAVVDGAVCGAELLLPHGQQVLRCQWCSATYPPGVWAALRMAQTKVSAA